MLRRATRSVVVAMPLLASVATAGVIRVPTQIASFRVAVATAAPGDTLQLIGNGGATYVNSDVRIDKDLTIQGGWRADFQVRDPQTYVSVIRDTAGEPTAPLLRVLGSPRVTLDGVWIWGGTVGVLAEGGPDLVLKDCTLRNQRHVDSGGDVELNRGGAIRLVGGSLLLVGCRVANVSSAYGGAGIAAISSSSVVLVNSTLTNCVSNRTLGDASGGGIFARNVGTLRIEGSTLTDCITVQHGGLVAAEGTPVTVISSQFLRALASTNGGAFSLTGCAATFDDCLFQDNRGIRGGAIRALVGSSVTLRNCVFRTNRGTSQGGAVWLDSSVLVAESTRFEQNHVSGGPSTVVSEKGGAVYVVATDATVTDCSFTNELASGKGGAWYQVGGQVSIARTTFTGCESGVFGGAACIELGGRIDMNRVLVSDCRARFGGGLASSFTGEIRVDRGTIVGGYGQSAGAGVYVDTGGVVELVDTILCCAVQGDLVFCSGGAVHADHSTVWNDDSGNIRVEWGGSCPDPTGADGNLKVAPGFCPGDPDFRIDSSSSSAGSASDGGDRGWQDAGCSTVDPLGMESSSWGRIKAGWRDR